MMAKSKNLTVISSATLIEIVKGEKVERAPGTPVSLPEAEARGLVNRGLAKFVTATVSQSSLLPDGGGGGGGDDGNGEGEPPPPGSTS